MEKERRIKWEKRKRMGMSGTGTGTGMLSRLSITNINNQKVAAAGDDQLAEPALPFLFKSVMFEY